MLPQRRFARSISTPPPPGPLVYFSYAKSLEAQRNARPTRRRLAWALLSAVVTGFGGLAVCCLLGSGYGGVYVLTNALLSVALLVMQPSLAAVSGRSLVMTEPRGDDRA